MSAAKTWADLASRGCLCGSDRPADCALHEPRDNRGLRAFFQAGQPLGFPAPATCTLCGTDGLLYPNIEIDDPKRSGEYRPTLVCPRCSCPAAEATLVADTCDFGFELNPRRIFHSPDEVAA